ncbi:hypothetical protein SAMN02745664_10149 [Moraxella cuniculi DSM 21768]|uniref:Uncharacterized protein n=1 Tax=Moraxella cuniculi DSM 21768 TaxID=1122245 RepID=A0A1N7D7G9_9GAMM|nr:hypothetical protein [Moraxella cuniculi]OOS07879.1 hypothetical protein B0189_00540 [Moraxella cuniculi]SIR71752.1 hypothetical protein SAMN02745664_10149 [Moraxella cuniculi DSM 21768]
MTTSSYGDISHDTLGHCEHFVLQAVIDDAHQQSVNHFTPAKITASLCNQNDALQLCFYVEKTTHTHALFDPIINQSKAACRADFLWEMDCFECFIAEKQADNYIEINAAVDSRYNIYRFENYRTPSTLPPIMDFEHDLQQKISSTPDAYVLKLQICHMLKPLLRANLDINITAILYPLIDDCRVPVYYAITHATTPDFHQRQYWH